MLCKLTSESTAAVRSASTPWSGGPASLQTAALLTACLYNVHARASTFLRGEKGKTSQYDHEPRGTETERGEGGQLGEKEIVPSVEFQFFLVGLHP